ncbi:MAG TPA: acetyl-CoA carboxylase biotin carboxylase subunit [Candidatus Binatia bacterium]|nr:acetyl-CoA carboxylase biotin carboxylase subunit [Candidatus Binatia bacterium]
MFRKVLIANRGEIAVRIIRTLREMGIGAVAVYSDADRTSLHVRMADEAAHVGPSPSAESYLCIDRLIDAARTHGAEAIHPGYGFLSENAEFAAACDAAGLVFIGPSAESIRKMGLKTPARELAIAAGVPVVPGMQHAARDAEEARMFARDCGYPVLLKAVAGGGGKGMRRVDGDEDLGSAFRDAASEAERAFGNAAIYVEKLIERPRHIEVQLMGDRQGHIIYLGERECSLQRRHQKIMEECPSPLVSEHPEMRHDMGEAAVRIARAAGYHSAGTAEFLVDAARNFYFLEMNTRLQVEHPVTELVTGLDLVRLQLEIAAGEPLRLRQEEIGWRGAAIECRIYAEDPDNHFFPSPGRIQHLDRPLGPGIRIDSGVYPGWTVPLDYDPLLAKLAVWAGSREQAVARMIRALDECHIVGIKTNIGFFRQLMEDDQYRRGELHTGLVDEFLARRPAPEKDPELQAVAALVGQAFLPARSALKDNGRGRHAASAWRTEGREQLLQ